VPPAQIERLRSKAFSGPDGEAVLVVADCTNLNCQSSRLSELIRQQLHSTYYGHTCGKYCVGMSPIGGCVFVSPGQGGPASDHQCMEAGGLFEPEKWAVGEGERWPILLYDAGVDTTTRAAAVVAACDLVTSGIKRKSKDSTLSALQRAENFGSSSMRIRVENMIGIVKRRFKILAETSIIPIEDIGMMDKIVYICFILHNFGPQTVE
jgi:hypothetical protein